jgi:hypothetical protein
VISIGTDKRLEYTIPLFSVGCHSLGPWGKGRQCLRIWTLVGGGRRLGRDATPSYFSSFSHFSWPQAPVCGRLVLAIIQTLQMEWRDQVTFHWRAPGGVGMIGQRQAECDGRSQPRSVRCSNTREGEDFGPVGMPPSSCPGISISTVRSSSRETLNRTRASISSASGTAE